MIELKLPDADATQAAASHLADCLLPSMSSTHKSRVVFLHGELGAGKSTWVRGFLAAAGISGAMPSPTYSLVERYSSGNVNLFHIDAYRLSDASELEYLDVDDMFGTGAIVFVEWPVCIASELPDPDIQITLDYDEALTSRFSQGETITAASGGRILKMVFSETTDSALERAANADYWSKFNQINIWEKGAILLKFNNIIWQS